ncbi:hypothetical protein [Chryseolinea sp. H1M3-3]|uniref:baeRF3 domain-containing protein n=1 Tax=Chryseolinea sp. H1M3-3 TaxID=3034144 RepID=UPI0023EB0612|nr:hypothetical protein [Chryseolinea sp. H1M3-3]
MNLSDIKQLLTEKGNPCITITVPTHRYSRERMQDPIAVRKAIDHAKDLLNNSAWPKQVGMQLQEKLDTLSEKIDYLRLQEGMAIFVSPNVSRILLLPFEVKEKVMLGKNFEIRDLFYFAQFLKPYYLLAVSKKRVPLFKCQGWDLQEIRNDDFPKQYSEEYEYARPSITNDSSSGLKSYERDKSILQETRQIAFIKQVDEAIDKYIKGDVPLLVAGVEEQLANFEHVTHHRENVIGKIRGNYEYDALHPLSELAWSKMKEYIRSSQKETLQKLQEAFGKNLATDGIRDVWKAANEGKGLTLLVEKDYQEAAYKDPGNDTRIYLSPPAGNYEIISDAVDDLIEIVNEKGGEIVIVENGELEKNGRVAMLLRYA